MSSENKFEFCVGVAYKPLFEDWELLNDDSLLGATYDHYSGAYKALDSYVAEDYYKGVDDRVYEVFYRLAGSNNVWELF